jgi:imidazoleglycerol-phosphate dehydratase
MSKTDFHERTASVERSTDETQITVTLNLDGTGAYRSDTGIGFLNHMLDLFARHSGIDLEVSCNGDLHVDDHHSAEDVAISLGRAFADALGAKEYIARYGHAYVPMDEALARAAVDLSGRFFLHFDADFSREKVGDFSTELVSHFWGSFAEQVGCSLHVSVLYGRNDHHKIEAIFKAVARALKMAIQRDATGARIPSTKGTL